MAYHNWKRFSDPEMETILRHLRVMLKGRKAIISMYMPSAEMDVSTDKALDRVMATGTPEIRILTPKTKLILHYQDRKSRNKFWLDITSYGKSTEKVSYQKIGNIPYISYSKDVLDARDVYDTVREILNKNEGWKI